METESTVSEKTLPLNLVISKLGMANLSGDKEIMMLQDALDAALMFLEGNSAALARVASAVRQTLGDDVEDIAYSEYSSYLTLLQNYCLGGDGLIESDGWHSIGYDDFCKLIGLVAYDGGAELGSSLELYETYLDCPKSIVDPRLQL